MFWKMSNLTHYKKLQQNLKHSIYMKIELGKCILLHKWIVGEFEGAMAMWIVLFKLLEMELTEGKISNYLVWKKL